MPKFILIAEDDDTHCMLYKEFLCDFCEKIVWAQNGQEAIDLFHRTESIQLVILDINLPQKTGTDIVSILKNNGREIKVVAVSAYGEGVAKNDMLNLGFDDYFYKPIRRAQILGIIEKYLKL